MKRALTIAFLLSSFVVFAQIDTYRIDSFKFYDDGSVTVYLSLNGNIDNTVRSFIEREFKSTDGIISFHFYNDRDHTKLMYTAESTFDEKQLSKLIYNVNASCSGIIYDENTTPEMVYKVFALETACAESEMEQVKEILLSYDFILSVAFGSSREIKLGLLTGFDSLDVESALSDAGLNITR